MLSVTVLMINKLGEISITLTLEIHLNLRCLQLLDINLFFHQENQLIEIEYSFYLTAAGLFLFFTNILFSNLCIYSRTSTGYKSRLFWL